MFLDTARISIQAGNGGDGAISFLRTKISPNGGPDGGNGGKGGDIYFVAKKDLNTLYYFKFKTKFKADDGEDGAKRMCTGKDGKNLYVFVPCGTLIKDAVTGKILADLIEEGSEIQVLRGGKGGRGNMTYKSSTRQSPRFSQSGEKTKRFEVILELKVIADVGLVGYPNVGKSTLLSTITNAKPKIANYHFTTLTPNLGVVAFHENSFVIADIPGLIEGASEGVGLGYEFLKHIERVRLIVHMVDISEIEERNAFEDYLKINKELKNYSDILSNLPQIIAFAKIDLISEEKLNERIDLFKKKLKALKKPIPDIIPISAVTSKGLSELNNAIWKMLEKIPKTQPIEVEKFFLDERDVTSLEIIKEDEHVYRIAGGFIDNLIRGVVLSDNASFAYFQRRLRQEGILSKLRKEGAVDGDTIRIKDVEFTLTD